MLSMPSVSRPALSNINDNNNSYRDNKDNIDEMSPQNSVKSQSRSVSQSQSSTQSSTLSIPRNASRARSTTAIGGMYVCT